jgi:hypothetical protein
LRSCRGKNLGHQFTYNTPHATQRHTPTTPHNETTAHKETQRKITTHSYLEAVKNVGFVVGVDDAQEDVHALFKLAPAFAQHTVQLAVHLSAKRCNELKLLSC